ncbi:MAG: TetR/AcrR family transcriptional regulator [Gammaproteobacteria bacterium]|nr:TetR/AcrR family transcriptional regulator [Gammaproteobacteria bacterium]
MPKVDEEHKQARRGQIVEAAIKCFSRKGFHPATMQDICKEAGLSAGAVYSYFKSKEEIIQVMAQTSAEQNDAIFASIQQDMPVREALAYIKDIFFRQMLEQPLAQECGRMDLMLMGEALSDPTIMQAYQSNIQRFVEQLSKLIRRGKTRGELKQAVDEHALASLLFATHQGLMIQMLLNQNVNTKEYDKVMDVMINSLFG